tara:strand:+ start:1083 stop:1271 length:189 start_codon:yes stop_codon:yes gene_type:complete
MSYSVHSTTMDNEVVYKKDDNTRSCIGVDPEFQAWLLANKDSLPDDIQAKIDAGELTIADAD